MVLRISIIRRSFAAAAADEQHRSFHFSGQDGDFTARKERKQRGSWYWVAYRQFHNKLFKTYLGKSACLSEARLQAAARTLQLLAGGHNDGDEPVTK